MSWRANAVSYALMTPICPSAAAACLWGMSFGRCARPRRTTPADAAPDGGATISAARGDCVARDADHLARRGVLRRDLVDEGVDAGAVETTVAAREDGAPDLD